MHPPFSAGVGGVEPPTKFPRSGGGERESGGGLDRISIFRRGVAHKEGGDFFQGDCSFYIKK